LNNQNLENPFLEDNRNFQAPALEDFFVLKLAGQIKLGLKTRKA